MAGKLLIFSAPSGAGKSTIVKALMQRVSGLEFSVSATNRSPREGEKDGVHYHFLSTPAFREKIKNSDFVEWEEVYPGRYYGTLKSEIENRLNDGVNVVFDIDVVGGLNIKKMFGDQALSFFIAPPDLKTLEERLVKRGTENEESLQTRLSKAVAEMGYKHQFDCVIINDDLEDAVNKTVKRVEEFLSP